MAGAAVLGVLRLTGEMHPLAADRLELRHEPQGVSLDAPQGARIVEMQGVASGPAFADGSLTSLDDPGGFASHRRGPRAFPILIDRPDQRDEGQDGSDFAPRAHASSGRGNLLE